MDAAGVLSVYDKARVESGLSSAGDCTQSVTGGGQPRMELDQSRMEVNE